MIFGVWGDGKRLWSSPKLRRGDAAVPFDLDLTGVRELTLTMSDAMDGNGGDHAAWLNVSIQHGGTKPRPLPFMKTLNLLPERTRQTIDNFAASDSWTVEPLIHWPEERRAEIARLLFCQETGAGLSGWRHNLGGGINHETISVPFRTADTYDAGEGLFDFTRVPGQRWMLEAAREHGVSTFVAYAITPPMRLTRNGRTNGTDGQGSTNLIDGGEDAYARYMVGVVEHYRALGYPFTHISPINEPDYEWNEGSQEGSRASNPDIARVNRALAEEISRRNLPVRVLTPEASSANKAYDANDGMEKKYGAPYGNYADFFAQERPEGSVYAYHSYWTDGLGNMAEVRRRLREAMDHVPGMDVWQTEYCQMAGPRGEGGWGRDLSMTLALNVARLMTLDLTLVDVSAWQWWLGVSDSDYKDGLVYVDDIDKSDGEVFASKTLWAIGQFSRFVRPGYRRIETDGPFEDNTATLASAFISPDAERVVVVLVNPDTRTDLVNPRLEGEWRASAWITSDRPGHDIAPWEAQFGEPIRVPSRSVVTVVFDRVSS